MFSPRRESEGRNYFPGDEQSVHRLLGNDDDKRYLAKLQAADLQKGDWSYDQMLKDSERILADINLDLAEQWSAQQFEKAYDPAAIEADARREEERDRIEDGSYRAEMEGIAKHEQKSEYDLMLEQAAERDKFSKQEPDKGMELEQPIQCLVLVVADHDSEPSLKLDADVLPAFH